MIENNYKITTNELNTVILASAASLPDSPHERGLGARAVKKTFSEPIRLLTGLINEKLEALRNDSLGAPASFSAILGENISGLYLWLDCRYPSSSGNGLINLVNPSKPCIVGNIPTNGSDITIEKGAELSVKGGNGDVAVSLSCDCATVPSCLFTLWESNLFYVSVYKISDTVCRVLYRYPQLTADQSYDFSVNPGEHVHIMASKNDDSVTFYSQGNLVCSVAIPFFEPTSLRIGMDNSDTGYGILLKSLRMFDKSLSPKEATGEYEAYRQREDNYEKRISHVLNHSLDLTSSVREVFERAVNGMKIEMDEKSFTLSFMPVSLDGKDMLEDPYKIDLPLEEMIVGGEYVDTKENPESIMLSLRSGNTIFIPVGALVKGLINSEDFSRLESTVNQNIKEISDIKGNAFFGASFDGEKREISFYPENSNTPVGKIGLDLFMSEPYEKVSGPYAHCKTVADVPHRVRVTPRRKNKILGATDLKVVQGELSGSENAMYYGISGNASFNIICDDMTDKAVYTLSFSANEYAGDFSVSVYGMTPVAVNKSGRTQVSFIYDKSLYGGKIPVCDEARTTVNAELHSFTLTKGYDADYIPIPSSADTVTVKSCGKNLLNPDLLATAPVESGERSLSGDRFTLVATGAHCYTATFYEPLKIPVSPGEHITFSWEASNTDVPGTVYIFGNGSTKSMVFAPAADGRLTYTVPEGISFITYRVGVSGIGNIITYSKMQIERADEPTPYEPFSQGESVSVNVDEVGYLAPIPPCMNVYVSGNLATCDTEFLKGGAVASATELILSDPNHRVNDHITSVGIQYGAENKKLLLKLCRGDSEESSVDITSTMREFIIEILEGGV